jgi:hypothetical protein
MKSQTTQHSGRRHEEKLSQRASNLQAPWPDQKARQEMSESELARESGKHEKNADWKKSW